MLVMLVVGIPIYVCASASTPVAAALILKGMSPGAVLVFLLAGPATNVATMAVVRKMMGTRGLVIYVLSIGICALLLGLALNAVYSIFELSALSMLAYQPEEGIGCASHVGGVVFAALLLWAMLKPFGNRLLQRVKERRA